MQRKALSMFAVAFVGQKTCDGKLKLIGKLKIKNMKVLYGTCSVRTHYFQVAF